MIELAPYVHEAACWRLIGELARRHPDRFWVSTERHSIGSEQAFLLDEESATLTPLAVFGLPGSAAVPFSGNDRMEWRDAFLETVDPRDWLIEFERLVGLPTSTGGRPPSTRSSVALRCIGPFLQLMVGSRERWIAGSVWRWPTPGPLAQQMTERKESNSQSGQRPDIFIGTTSADYPVIAITPDGSMRAEHAPPRDLFAAYRRTRSLSTTVSDAFGVWLP